MHTDTMTSTHLRGLSIRAERPGGDAELASFDLPPGRTVYRPDGTLFCWVSALEAPGLDRLWTDAMLRFSETGLWPIRAEEQDDWEWHSQWAKAGRWPEDEPPVTSPLDRFDHDFAEEEGLTPEAYAQDVAEVSWTPDLQLAEATSSTPWTRVDVEAPAHINRVILVPVERPCDVPLTLHWGVPNDGLSPYAFATCLRSWEERFGAVLTWMIAISWAEIELTAPPTDQLNARRLGIELMVFSTDSWMQGGLGGNARGEFDGPERLGRSTSWSLWWD